MSARSFCLAAMLACVAGPSLVAQGPPLPERPIPVGPPPVPQTPLSPAPPPPTTDPGPNGWGPVYETSQAPGFFFDTQTTLIKPALKNRIGNEATQDGTFRVPSVDLDLSLMSTIEVGYRMPDSGGYVAFSYTFFAAEGTGPTVTDGTTFDTRTRVNVNTFDLDYGTTPTEFAPRYTVSARIGARISDIFFDSRVTNGDFLRQGSNSFFGSGPHARLDLERRIVALPGLSLFGRVDGSVLIGQIQQRFRQEMPAFNDATMTDEIIAAETTVRKTQAVPTLNLQLGLSYSPEWLCGMKITSGYQFEQYWYLGQLGLMPNGEPSSSRGELWSHGWFLRGQVDF